jgi:hypothetical protein
MTALLHGSLLGLFLRAKLFIGVPHQTMRVMVETKKYATVRIVHSNLSEADVVSCSESRFCPHRFRIEPEDPRGSSRFMAVMDAGR